LASRSSDNLGRRCCQNNSKSPVLAIFSRFLFPFETIAEPLISLMIDNVLMLSHVISQNPK